MILVTGASGFIGGHVARLLVARGQAVRVLVRPTSDLSCIGDLRVERAIGDLCEVSTLRKAFRGCTRLFHVAADYRLWAKDPGEIYRSNVEGTRKILQVAAETGIEKVVYTSTVGALGFPKDGTLGSEDSPVSIKDMSGPYKRSKFEAEQVALKFASEGLPVVIVNPTAPVGEGDLKPTPTGKIIVDFLRGAMPAYVDTGLNLVDVRDVAAGHLLAAEKGEAGERYILGARNMTLREIFETLGVLSGRPAPRLRLPYWMALGFGLGEAAASRLTGKEPRAPLEAVRMARHKMFVSTDKAQRELGYQPGPVEDALRRAVEWFRKHHYC
ncbi:MAG: hopanoid-associated sugar epimerase [Bryobacterales bacterium]